MLRDWITIVIIIAGLSFIDGYSNYQVLSTPSPTTKPSCNDEPRSNAARLKKDLFCGYDSSVRPVPHHSNQTVVKMTAFPLNIGWIMQEKNQLWMSFWVYMKWKDNLLTWDVSKYDGLDEFYAETGKIWTPDIFVSDPPQTSSISRGMNCAIGSTGLVDCSQSVSVLAHCSIDLKYYPFDRHNCRIVFQPRSYKGSELDVNFIDSKGMDLLRMFHSHGSWDLHSLKATRNVTEIYNNVKSINIEYTFVIQRKSATTSIIYAAPAFVMVLMVVSVFWLEVQCSARLLLPALTVICHLLIIRWLMEVIDANFTNLPVIIVFFRDSLLLTGLALVWSVVARSLCNSSSSPYLLYLATTNLNDSQIVKFLLPQDIFLKSGASGDEDESSPVVVHRDCVEQRWRILITLTDRLLCGLCLLVYTYLYLSLTP